MCSKMASAKWRLFCLCLSVLRSCLSRHCRQWWIKWVFILIEFLSALIILISTGATAAQQSDFCDRKSPCSVHNLDWVKTFIILGNYRKFLRNEYHEYISYLTNIKYNSLQVYATVFLRVHWWYFHLDYTLKSWLLVLIILKYLKVVINISNNYFTCHQMEIEYELHNYCLNNYVWCLHFIMAHRYLIMGYLKWMLIWIKNVSFAELYVVPDANTRETN